MGLRDEWQHLQRTADRALARVSYMTVTTTQTREGQGRATAWTEISLDADITSVTGSDPPEPLAVLHGQALAAAVYFAGERLRALARLVGVIA